MLVDLYRQGRLTQHQLGLSLDKSRFGVDELLKRHRVTEDLDTAEQVAEQITLHAKRPICNSSVIMQMYLGEGQR